MKILRARTCNICNQKVNSDVFELHCEQEHPDYFIGKDGRTLYKKEYFNPLTNMWYNARKLLAKSVKECGLTNEQYYNQYGKDYMTVEWHENEYDPVKGNAANTGKCLECGKQLRFIPEEWRYGCFCYNSDCNVKFYNRTTNRAERAAVKITETLSSGDVVPSQLGYWIKRCDTIEEALIMYKKRQTTFSKEICIEKYGVDEGIKIWNERQEKWISSLKEAGMFNGFSTVASQLMGSVQSRLPSDLPALRYGAEEAWFTCKGSTYVPDCWLPGTNKIIEFFGDYWHANPNKYTDTKIIKGKTMSEIHERDTIRLVKMKDCGLDVLVIWEDAYYKDSQHVIDRCVEHLTTDVQPYKHEIKKRFRTTNKV